MKMNKVRFNRIANIARISVLSLPLIASTLMAEPAAEGAVAAASTGDYGTVAKYIAIALMMFL